MSYHHTQRALLISLVCLALAGLDVAVTWRSGNWPAITFPLIFVAIVVLFSSLTVEVDDSELRWHFGPGLWSYRLPLSDIEKVSVVRNHWWSGFGIRTRPGFRLYNISGLDAVELRLKSNEVRRIGTDDPQGLAEALKAQAGMR